MCVYTYDILTVLSLSWSFDLMIDYTFCFYCILVPVCMLCKMCLRELYFAMTNITNESKTR